MQKKNKKNKKKKEQRIRRHDDAFSDHGTGFGSLLLPVGRKRFEP